MIKHYVFFELKEGYEGESKQESAEIVKKAFEEMRGNIPELRHIEVGLSAKVDSLSKEVDVLLYCEFESFEDMGSYHAHPEFLKTIEIVRPRRLNRWAVDVDVEV